MKSLNKARLSVFSFLIFALFLQCPAVGSTAATPETATSATPISIKPVKLTKRVIAWAEKPVDMGATLFYQGYFPHSEPWVPPQVTVPDFVKDNSGSRPNPDVRNVPGRYPVAYQIDKLPVARNTLILEAELHKDGGLSAYCEGYGRYEKTALSVRNCTAEYPGRHGGNDEYFYGMGWWTYWGGTQKCPQCARNSDGRRIARSLVEVGQRHANLIDKGAGITLTGTDYGGTGAIMQSFIIPYVQKRISVVYAKRAITQFHEWTYTEYQYIPLAWGNKKPSTVDFSRLAKTGKLDHIWYRIDGSTAPVENGNATPLHLEFFQHCNTHKIACLGTWHASADNTISEPGITIPQEKYPDPNMTVRLDKPLPVFTNFSQNSSQPRGYYNLGLSWNTADIRETESALTLPIKYLANRGMSKDATRPVVNQRAVATTSLTVRRSKIFIMKPGNAIVWAYGSQKGSVVADAKHEVTINNLRLTSSETTYTDLVLTRR
ncbi:MAG: hypothetical protein ACI9JM_001199 [Halioglobus sp.]|jgi:hypothetical protein